jgi:undecaprenyl diphosphate synthase
MKQSVLPHEDTTAAYPETRPGLHVALIMDGNGRWATRRGRPRSAGHRAGAHVARAVIEAAHPLGITTLTLYMFSSDNWQRPTHEVTSLMRLLRVYLRAEVNTCLTNGVRLSVIGRRDRLPRAVRMAIEEAEGATASGRRLHLRLAVDYSARDMLARAAHACRIDGLTTDARDARDARDAEDARAAFARALGAACHLDGPAPDVDLLVRTGGEQRLSDFLLWECAYAELVFTPCLWPDFTPADLGAAVRDFHSRERRFGRVRQPEASPA